MFSAFFVILRLFCARFFASYVAKVAAVRAIVGWTFEESPKEEKEGEEKDDGKTAG